MPQPHSKGVTFDLSRGRTTIGADQFAADVRVLQPAFAESLHPNVAADKSRSRHGKAMKQTLSMLHETAAALGTDRLFAALQGGVDVALREIAMRDLLKGQYAGYSLAGFGTGETVDERAAVLRAVVPSLPADKPRLIAGIDSFEQILACVESGIDLFVSRAAQTATEDGKALGVALGGAQVGADRTLALRDPKYRVDKSAIDAECACFTCRTYSRAYLNHLLNTHELLAPTLLMYHNLHVMEQFFGTVRAHIDSGTFETFHTEFVTNRRREFHESREPLLL
jgi:queuine tRNA-ribosyltransferase subunit QTRTD1